jgi:hypothetical protein
MKTKIYRLTLIQDFECLQYDVDIKATSLDEAMELATKPENRPDWVKEVISKAEELGIIEDRCEVWQFRTEVEEEDEEETVSVIPDQFREYCEQNNIDVNWAFDQWSKIPEDRLDWLKEATSIQFSRNEEDEEETVSVIVIKNGVVEEGYKFSGKRDEIATSAEKRFLELCHDKISNFDEYTPDDITAILDDGLAEYGGGSICIHWF